MVKIKTVSVSAICSEDDSLVILLSEFILFFFVLDEIKSSLSQTVGEEGYQTELAQITSTYGDGIINTLKDKDLGDKLLFSTSMLRSDGDLFLDDMHIDDFRAAVKTPVRIVENNGAALYEALLGC